jgi:hypothetical protein
MKILSAIKSFLKWVKHLFWDVPTAKPLKTLPVRTMAVDVAKDYMVITYRGQRINMLKIQYPVWKTSSRKDKRITMLKVKAMEEKGEIKFQEVNGNLICIRNLNYQARVEKAKQR